MSASIRVELVYATADEQALIELHVAQGSSVQDVIDSSAISERFPNADLAACDVGIWGRPVERSDIVRDGNRVELYRQLKMDPREARRVRARG